MDIYLQDPDNRPPYSVFPQVTFLVIISLKILVILTSTMVVFVSHQISLVVFMAYFYTYGETIDTDGPYADSEDQAFPLFDR